MPEDSPVMDKKLTDNPIETLDEDSLNIKNFTDALTDTIIETYTPYSISLYGEWGSGKTSILNIVKKSLEDKGYNIVWINAWTILTLAGQKELRNLFIAQIISSLFPVFDNLKRLLKPFLVDSVTNFISTHFSVDKKYTQEVIRQIVAVPLQERFKLAIEMANTKKGTDKTIIFVDDLDRIKPAEVLVILDAISIFFKVKGCVFVLAMDHHRINSAIEKINNLTAGQQYHSNYLDKVVQLNIAVPIKDYSIRTLLKKLLNITDNDKLEVITLDYCTTITIHSIGKIPRNIKKVCAKFSFYKKFFKHYDMINAQYIRTNFYPFGIIFLHRCLFAMLCFQEAYPELYNKFINSRYFYKEYLLHIRDAAIDNAINTDKNIISFIDALISTIDIYSNEKNSLSESGIYLVERISKLIQHDDNSQDNDSYMLSLSHKLKQECLERHFNFIIKNKIQITNKVSCTILPNKILVKLPYKCNATSFNFCILYENNIIKVYIESRASNIKSYKYNINKWLHENYTGLPESTFTQYEAQFIRFDDIIYTEYRESKYNPPRFFIRTTDSLLKTMVKKFVDLNDRNKIVISVLSEKNNFLNRQIQDIFPQADNWIIDGRIDIHDRWNGIMISKKTWDEKLHICLEPQRPYMQEFVVGIRKTRWNGKFIENSEEEFRNIAASRYNISFLHSLHWVLYHYTTPRSLSESDYFSGLKLLFEPDDDPITPIINELKKFKDLEKEIEELARKARY